MPQALPIPALAHDVMTDLIGLCRKTATYAKQEKGRADRLEKLAADLSRAAVPAVTHRKFDQRTLDRWVTLSKQAGVIDASLDNVKAAAMIQNDPAQFIDNLLQMQLPPDPQGDMITKSAAEQKISGGKVLVDHDGWADCLS